MAMQWQQSTLLRLASLFSRQGSQDYIGEDVSIAQHCFQAATLAKLRDHSLHVQVAALLHDVGHLLGLEANLSPAMDGTGTQNHEGIAARFLSQLGFPHSVTHLVAKHVDAKRYLCAVDSDYHVRLSDASKTSLRFQGGPMNAAEVVAFRADPLCDAILQLREVDEAAKVIGMSEHQFGRDFAPLVRTYLEQHSTKEAAGAYVVSEEQLRAWKETGILIIRGLFGKEEVQAATDALHREPKGSYLDHYEIIEGAVRPQLCRIENFCQKGWWSHTAHTILTPLVGQVLSNGTSTDTAILFKDKLNFKPPGGGGFACHQDVTAYKPEDLVDYHITALVAIDASTRLKGPFEVARGWSGRREILPHAYGAVHKEAEDALEFEEVCVEAGDVVLFDSWIPHRAGRNGSADSRRAAFLTYNCKSAGNFHARYYAMKAELMMKGSMSLNLDFNGTLVVE